MKRQITGSAWAALLLCATMSVAQTTGSSQRITPNFQNVDIAVVAEAVGNATGTQFILDPRVRAQITLLNARPMSPRELYDAFLSILQVYNFAAVRQGNTVKIVPDAIVRTMGSDTATASNPGPDDMVDAVIEVQNISAMQLQTVLRPLLAQYGSMAQVPGTNRLLVTDRAGNIARMRRIIAAVDQGSDNDISVISLEHADAANIVRTLTSLQTGQPAAEGAAGGNAPRVVADERSNSVVVSGDSTQRLRIAAWIASLDTELKNGGGPQVIRLKYAKAEDLATRLKEHAGGIAAATGAAAPAGAASASAGGASSRSVTISADKTTNSLIITAPPKMVAELRTVIDQLDIPLAQVHVEAIIADVSEELAADLGVNWAIFSNEDNTTTPAGGFISPVGTANNNGVTIVDLARAIADPASATAVPLGATLGVGRIRANGTNMVAMIRAMRSDGNTNVIAEPNVTTTDNEEAELRNTQEVPFLTGQYTSTGGTNNSVNPFTTVQRQEVGVILKVTPQINDARSMIVNIELESSELSGTAGDAGSLITNKRVVKTSVRIEDGGIIVVGGLKRDSRVSGENRVPLLSRIPLIGEVFRTRSGKRSKSTLMVFIRPKILQDSLQAAIETNAKYNQIRDAQRAQGARVEFLPILPGERPLLPPAPPLPEPAGNTTP